MNKKPLFIHSLFRTGSTYIWSKFRQNESYYCYYEPLHQFLTKVTADNIRHIMTGNYKSVNHPELDKYYLYEYKPLLKEGLTGIPFFKKSFSFENFCFSDNIPGLKQYLDYLIEGAQDKIPVLQFNRSAFRIKWFNENYSDSLNIYLLRNPRDQWQSYFELYNRTGYRGFFVMDLLIAGINKDSREYRLLAEILPLMDFHDETQEKEDEFYRVILDSYSSEEKYLLFYYTWFKALVGNVLHADFIININLLSGSPAYREKVETFLSGRGHTGVNFEDSRTKEYSSYFLPVEIMDRIEAEARDTILRSLSGKQIDLFFRKLPAEDRDYLRFDLTDFKKRSKTKPGAGSDFRKKTTGKLKKMVEMFASEYFARLERNRDLENQVKAIDEMVKERDRHLEEKNRLIAEQGRQLNQKEQAILTKANELRQMNALFVDKDTQLQQRVNDLQQRDRQIEEKNRLLTVKGDQLEAKDKLIDQKEKEIANKDLELREMNVSLVEKDTQLQQRVNELQQRDGELRQRDRQIEEKNRLIAEQGQQLNQKGQTILTKENELREKSSLLVDKDKQLEQRVNELQQKESQLAAVGEQYAQMEMIVRRVRGSYTYRAGKVVTFPFRMAKKLFTKLRK